MFNMDHVNTRKLKMVCWGGEGHSERGGSRLYVKSKYRWATLRTEASKELHGGMRKGEDKGMFNKRNMNEEATWKSMSSNPSKTYNKGRVEHMSHEGTGVEWRTPGLKV